MRKNHKSLWRWLIAVVAVAAAIGVIVSSSVNSSRKAEERAQEAAELELNVPSLATATGSFAVNKEGKAVPLEEATDAKRVEFVLDPHCIGCKTVETGLHDTMKELMESGAAQFYFTPVSFMNYASKDDYSARAGSTLIEVAETDPEHFFAYLNALYNNFPPEGANYPHKGVSYDDLARVAKAAGVNESAIDRFKEQRFRLWITENTKVNEARAEIFPQGISTPTVLVGGELVKKDDSFKLEDFKKVQFSNETSVVDSFTQALDSVE